MSFSLVKYALDEESISLGIRAIEVGFLFPRYHHSKNYVLHAIAATSPSVQTPSSAYASWPRGHWLALFRMLDSLLSIQYFNETENLLLVLLKFCVITNVCQSISIFGRNQDVMGAMQYSPLGNNRTWMGICRQ
jgi:hypothetical protein